QVLRAITSGSMRMVVKSVNYPTIFARMLMSDFIDGRVYEGEAVGTQLQAQLLSINRELATEWFGQDALQQTLTPEAVAKEKERLEQAFSHRTGNDVELFMRLKEQGDDVSAFLVMTRFIESKISFTARDVADRFGLSDADVEAFMEECEKKALIEPAPFSDHHAIEPTWITKTVLSRLIRTSIRSFEQESASVSSEAFFRELLALHHLTPETRQMGTDGLRLVIEHLQGFFMPLSQWE